MMKVLHVVDAMDPRKGGVSTAVQTMVIESNKFGIYNEVVSLDCADASYLNDLFIIHALGPSKTAWNYSNKLISWLLENILRFDAIIIHGLWLYHSYGTANALKKIKRVERKNGKCNFPKLFVMPHGMLDPYFQRSKERKIKAVRNWVYWRLIEGRVINHADGLLFTCQEECRLASQSFSPYHPKRKLIVGLGIVEPPAYNHKMLKAFLEKCPGIKNNPYILFLSRIDSKKGADLLIRAYEKVITEININKLHPLSNTGMEETFDKADHQPKIFPKLILAGPGIETSYGGKLQNMVNDSPILKNNVFFSGMLEGDAKWGAFYGCESFILPSHQENFGIAVVEALACSKPVLISRPINISVQIEAMNGGFVEGDTLEGTYNMLKLWYKTPDVVKLKMGYHARKCFESDFAIKPAINRLIKALR
jgi:glycosyltransferase involved in cell wall biosynthesis